MLAPAGVVKQDAWMRTRPCPNCYLCECSGDVLYRGLVDHLFGAPGTWDLRICPNARCGIAWLDPMPTEGDIGKAYNTYYTHRNQGELERSAESRLKRILDFAKRTYLMEKYRHGDCKLPRVARKVVSLPFSISRAFRESVEIPFAYLLRDRGRLLDVGCGDGGIVKLGCELGWDAVGVEVDPKAAANAQSVGLKVYLGSLASQGFPDNSFDLILMNHVIEHVHDPSSLLRECRRVLRPGALLVVVTPNIRSWGHARFGRDWRGIEPPRHLHIFSSRALAGIATSAGLKDVNISTTMRSAPFALRVSKSLRRAAADPTRKVEESEGQLYGWVASFAEQVLVNSDPLLGEELLLEAQK